MNHGRNRIFTLVMFLLFACVVTYGQQNSAITGTVTDKEGAAIPDAQVSLTADATGFVSNTVTNSAGLFSIPALNVGTYGLKVSMKGFQTYVAKGLEVNVSQTLRVDVSMSVGSVTETVTVSANALAVQADSNVVSSLINSEQINEIATQNRNFAALAAIGLGASSTMPDNNTPSSGAGGSSFNLSINGLRQSHNIWLIDGGESDDRGGAGGMQIMPSQDAISQFEVLASNYPPDYGISSGATISLGLKSGTRNFHASVWEFNRNTVYDANYFLNKQSNQKRPGLNYNIYGFNIGGPVAIPGVYNRDRSKTFFFWNEEWRNVKQSPSPSTNNTLPAADFPVAGQSLHYVAPAFASNSKILVPKTVTDPALVGPNGTWTKMGLVPGTPFPNDTIPAAIIDPNAVAYLSSGVVPKPNTASGQALTTAPTPLTVRDDLIRVDHRVNDKWQILGHYIHDSVTQTQGGPMLGWSGGSYNTITSVVNNPANSAAIKLTGQITPSLLTEVSMNYDGNVINIINSPNSLAPSGFSINRFFSNSSKNLPDVQWNGQYGGTNEKPASGPWHNAAQDYSPKVDVSYLSGKHSMKFGFSYNRYTKNQQLFGSPGGSLTFNNVTGGGLFDSSGNPVLDPTTGKQVSYSGDPFMDMLLGLAGSFSQAQALPVRHYVNQTTSFYVDDNWKVTPRLSLQLGLRYDALPHAWERGNNLSNFDPNAYLSGQAPNYLTSSGQMDPNGPGFATVNGSRFYLNGIYLAGVNGAPKGLVTNDYATLQPRVGFSEDLFGDGKTILRGGFGTFFERMQGNDVYNAATTAPFFNAPSASNVYLSSPSTSWTTGATAAQPFFAQGPTSLARSYKAPAVAQFSLGVQREIAPSVVAVVQYVGNLAWHQNVERRINNYSLNTPLAIRAWAGDGSNVSGTNSYASTTPGVAQQQANGDFNRAYQGWGQITQQENTTNGNYNGFQVGVRAQHWRNLSGEVDYTWSHAIDLTSSDLAQVSNPFNLKYDKGSGIYDRRHILNANYIYKLPFLTSPGMMHTLFGGWEISGTAIFQTGAIIANQGTSLSVGYDTIGLGGGYANRPDVVGKIHYLKTQKQWFDQSVFAAPTPAWAGSVSQGFGNARKDTVIGPGRVNFNTSLYKSFAMTERAHFELRFESFNTFNHTEFNGIGNSFQGFSGGASKGSFGQVTSTYDPRTLELGGKFIF